MINDPDFKLKFDGTQNQIDAAALIGSLIHLTNVIHEINLYLDSGHKIEIKIKAHEPGSFLCHIELIDRIVSAVRGFFSGENLTYATSIIEILVKLIELKKFLQSRRTRSVEKGATTTTIINYNGDVTQIDSAVFNIYTKSENIQDALAQTFDAINNDLAITGFEITDRHENPYLRIDREDFAMLAQKSEEITENERRITVAATLNIIRPSFDEKLKWDFYYQGNKIPAKVSDVGFYENIKRGESFAMGDMLKVELEILQRIDETVNAYVNKSYQVLRIIEHIPRGEQQQLNFTQDTD